MRASSLHQPWAWFVQARRKGIETRSWGTKYRGLLAIHAAKTRTSLEVLAPGQFAPYIGDAEIQDAPLVFGAIVAVAELVDCFQVGGHSIMKVGAFELSITEGGKTRTVAGGGASHQIIDTRGGAREIAPAELALGDLSIGRWAWVLKNVRALRVPVSVRGMQGLWAVDRVTEQLVLRDLAEATR